jgi:hypothetical protein
LALAHLLLLLGTVMLHWHGLVVGRNRLGNLAFFVGVLLDDNRDYRNNLRD